MRKLLEKRASHIYAVIERAARELYGRSACDIRSHGVLEQQLLASCAALQSAPSSVACRAALSYVMPFYAALVQAAHVSDEVRRGVAAVLDMLHSVLDTPPAWPPFG